MPSVAKRLRWSPCCGSPACARKQARVLRIGISKLALLRSSAECLPHFGENQAGPAALCVKPALSFMRAPPALRYASRRHHRATASDVVPTLKLSVSIMVGARATWEMALATISQPASGIAAAGTLNLKMWLYHQRRIALGHRNRPAAQSQRK